MKFLPFMLCLCLIALLLYACSKDEYVGDDGKALPDEEKMILATMNGDLSTIKKMHKQGASLTLRTTPTGRTPLHWAAAMGNLEIMKYLLDNGVDPNIVGADVSDVGNTPLHETTYNSRIEAAKLLLERGAKVDGVVPSGGGAMSPYVEAAWHQKIDMCRFLLTQGADGKYKQDNGDNALSLAMGNAYPSLELIKLVVEAGADVNVVINFADMELTPLVKAALINRKDIYDYLVSVGADPHRKDYFDNTPEDYSKGKAYPGINFNIEPYEEDGSNIGVPFR